MNAVKITAVLIVVMLSGPAVAQGTNQTQQGVSSSRGGTTGTNNSRNAVATQPSNNPFQNPIGQGVAPAANADPARNSNQSNVTLPRR